MAEQDSKDALTKDKLWKRLLLAVPVSVVLHVIMLLAGRPDHSPVLDRPVELEVLEAVAGPPPEAPEPEIPEAPPAPPPEEPPDEPAPKPEKDKKKEPPKAVAIADPIPADPLDAGVGPQLGDAGPTAIAMAKGDAGPGEGTGICFHDVFPYAPDDPSWLLWVSMSSFNGTSYERGLARVLGSQSLYKEMAGATGMDPYSEVEGFLVTSGDFADWRSYRVVATYNSGEERLKERLIRNRGDYRGFTWEETTAGFEGYVPGDYRWHLVGSGRVLAVTHEPPGKAEDDKKKDPPADRDAGVPTPPPPPAIMADGGAWKREAPPKKERKAPTFPSWPRQVTCMSLDSEASAPATSSFTRLARAQLTKDDSGAAPVMMIATKDPRALGLGGSAAVAKAFRWAVAKAYFSDPLRLEGTMVFDERVVGIESLAEGWKKQIASFSKDPFMMLAGLGGIFDKLEIRVEGNRIRFELPLKENQMKAVFMFLELQGQAIDEKIGRDNEKKPTKKTPSEAK